MELSHDDVKHAAGMFREFFSGFNRIDEYMRKIKMERVDLMPSTLPGMGHENDMFNKFDMHPNDMDFELCESKLSDFMIYMNLVTSAPVEKSIPGKNLNLVVKEKNTGLIVGMIRFGSPVINLKPRNEWLRSPLKTTDKDVMKRFNSSAIMGFNIVPTQPFGFNYLGGKLLAGICCSHEVREMLNKKYDANICLFETTSLYGNTKSASQYDGMKPFLRFSGLTDSNFIPMINDDKFRKLNDWFTEKNDGEPIIEPGSSSRKLKSQNKMIQIIKQNLKKYDINEYNEFCNIFEQARSLTERKRTFFSTYGYDNVADYLNMKTDTLVRKENYDRFSLNCITDWWHKKAANRYETLKKDNRVRTELETWNVNPDKIDIIR